MKVSLKWLRDYVDVSLPLKELAEKLTMAGIEVKNIEIRGQTWENIAVGQVIELAPHPNADRLKLATIDLGKEHITVVTGAPNLKTGDKVPFAYVGASLIDGHTGQTVQLKPAKIRGIVSQGMACSEKELGISQNHTGIMVLPPESPVGVPLADYLGDAILELEVTPNRPDCLCVLGIAREVAALLGQKARPPQLQYEELGAPVEQLAKVEIVAPDLCPRYCASLILGVKIAPSPHWMQDRLLACGMRPINNIVDVTNYVMLEYGQPLHAFDYEKLRERKILVRRAGNGESIVTLDGMERSLTSDTLVIADPSGTIAIAGVMGGVGSEVTETTSSALIESANFNPASIRRTSQGLRLRTEASLRFEKGLSPELPLPSIQRATQLMLELAGGKAAKGILDVYPGEKEKKPILLSTSQVQRLLGMDLSVKQVRGVLESLGFECKELTSSELEVIVPYWRGDVGSVADLVEEIARIMGYDKIPTTMLSSPIPRQQPDPFLLLRERVRDILAGCGLQEVITYSLTSQDRLSKVFVSQKALHLANPMSLEQEYLRTSLRPGLIYTLASNQRHEPGALKLFEIGKIYLPQEKDLPEEREMVLGVLNGARLGLSRWGEGGQLDWFDAKGVVEALLQRLGIEAEFVETGDEGFHPGKRARIVVKGDEVGVVGELNPKVADSFELLLLPVSLFEVDLGKLLPHLPKKSQYQPLSKFPSSTRDIALVVDSKVPVQKVQDIIRSSPLVVQSTLFDLYTGKQVPQGKKSLAFRLVYQSMTRTLTDEEVNQVQQEILEKLQRELGAVLRT